MDHEDVRGRCRITIRWLAAHCVLTGPLFSTCDLSGLPARHTERSQKRHMHLPARQSAPSAFQVQSPALALPHKNQPGKQSETADVQGSDCSAEELHCSVLSSLHRDDSCRCTSTNMQEFLMLLLPRCVESEHLQPTCSLINCVFACADWADHAHDAQCNGEDGLDTCHTTGFGDRVHVTLVHEDAHLPVCRTQIYPGEPQQPLSCTHVHELFSCLQHYSKDAQSQKPNTGSSMTIGGLSDHCL